MSKCNVIIKKISNTNRKIIWLMLKEKSTGKINKWTIEEMLTDWVGALQINTCRKIINLWLINIVFCLRSLKN